MEEEVYVLIDRYLSGDMNEAERDAFEKKLKIDPDLAEKVNLYKSVSRHLGSRFSEEKELDALKKNLSSIANEHIQSRKEDKVILLKWHYWAAAASVALICMVLIYRNSSTVPPEYASYAFHEPLELVERGGDSLYYRAGHVFNEKRYDQALQYLDRLLKSHPENPELQLYKGIALLELDDLEQARQIFNTLKDSNAVYRDKALWYLALTALKEKDYKTCKLFLQKISEESEYYARATEILDDL